MSQFFPDAAPAKLILAAMRQPRTAAIGLAKLTSEELETVIALLETITVAE